MNTMRKKPKEILEIIKPVVEKKVEGKEFFAKMVRDMVLKKMSTKMKEVFLQDFSVNVHVTNIEQMINEPRPMYIEEIEDIWMVYCFLKIVNDDIISDPKEYRVNVFKYKKDVYEVRTFMSTILSAFPFTDKGSILDFNEIEGILTNSDKKYYAKGAKKSVINTLTGKSKGDTFRVHKDAKFRIVSLGELSEKQLDIGKKHKELSCPICNMSYILDATNMDDMITIQKNTFVFNCLHEKTGNKEDLKKNVFSGDIGIYVGQTKNKREKQMFVIHNFTKLTQQNAQ